MKSRASNGRGTINKNAKMGRYEGKVSYRDPATGQSKRKSFVAHTRKELEAKMQQFKDEQEKILQKSCNEQEKIYTVGEWLHEWIDRYKKNELKPKTLERYLCAINQHIIPVLGNKMVSDITSKDVQSWINELFREGGVERKGLAPRTVNMARLVLKNAFEDAINNNIIDVNVVESTKGIRAKKAVPKRECILSHAEAARLLSVALRTGRIPYVILKVALCLGLRCGEIFGLRWSRIDLEKKTIEIDCQVVTTRQGILIQEYDTKTISGHRTLNMPKTLVDALKRYKLWIEANDIRLGTNCSATDWIFSNDKGRPRSPSTFSGHIFKPIVREAGLPEYFRFHDCRHTVATWLVASNKLSLEAVKNFLGHKKLASTEVYLHFVPQMSSDAAKVLDEIL